MLGEVMGISSDKTLAVDTWNNKSIISAEIISGRQQRIKQSVFSPLPPDFPPAICDLLSPPRLIACISVTRGVATSAEFFINLATDFDIWVIIVGEQRNSDVLPRNIHSAAGGKQEASSNGATCQILAKNAVQIFGVENLAVGGIEVI
ncbi:hypothetical protein JTB14_003799 [Gonioctena quinquepunctata]|nr:hypothetical protein JTB14_003799 [Gonioctena quinquepunctata]